jgi:ABC-type antimicrobial peptide transport system ATPase subunit
VLRALDAETAGRVMTDDETKAMNTITQGEVLNLGISLEKRANDFRQNVITLAKHDVQAVDQYNSLLADYKDYVSRVGYQMAQMNSSYSNQQRINNSLALYNAQDAQARKGLA